MTGVVAGQQVTRDLAALATVYLQARTHYGIVEPATLDRSARCGARCSASTT
jgi:hypothetical protein